MLTPRVLKRKDYWKLGEEKEKLFSSLPKESILVVSEDEEGIAGHWALIPYWHLECFEIYDSHRKKSGVAKGLFRIMYNILRSKSIRSAWTASMTEEVEKYLLRMKAVELPGKHFVLPTGDK